MKLNTYLNACVIVLFRLFSREAFHIHLHNTRGQKFIIGIFLVCNHDFGRLPILTMGVTKWGSTVP